jgi:hypothetical protein
MFQTNHVSLIMFKFTIQVLMYVQKLCPFRELHKTNHKCIVLFRTTFSTLVAFLFCDRHSCTSTKGTKSVLEKRRLSGFLSTRSAIHGNYIRKLLMNRPFLTECNTENFHVIFPLLFLCGSTTLL